MTTILTFAFWEWITTQALPHVLLALPQSLAAQQWSVLLVVALLPILVCLVIFVLLSNSICYSSNKGWSRLWTAACFFKTGFVNSIFNMDAISFLTNLKIDLRKLWSVKVTNCNSIGAGPNKPFVNTRTIFLGIAEFGILALNIFYRLRDFLVADSILKIKSNGRPQPLRHLDPASKAYIRWAIPENQTTVLVSAIGKRAANSLFHCVDIVARRFANRELYHYLSSVADNCVFHNISGLEPDSVIAIRYFQCSGMLQSCKRKMRDFYECLQTFVNQLNEMEAIC